MEKICSPLDSLYDFTIRPDYIPSKSSPFYAEYFWNLLKSSKSELNHFISLITPLALQSISSSELNEVNNYFFSNNSVTELNLVLIRNTVSHEIEGFLIYITFIEFFLPNNTTKENEYCVLSAFALANKNIRNKGIFELFSDLYIYPYCIKNIGKNCVFFDVALNPASYKNITRNFILFPSYYRQVPRLVEDFMLKLMKKHNYERISDEKPYVVKNAGLIDLDTEYWRKNYERLSNDIKFFIDQTELKPGYSLLFFSYTTLLQGNTLGLPCTQYYLKKKLPEILVKEFHFESPKL